MVWFRSLSYSPCVSGKPERGQAALAPSAVCPLTASQLWRTHHLLYSPPTQTRHTLAASTLSIFHRLLRVRYPPHRTVVSVPGPVLETENLGQFGLMCPPGLLSCAQDSKSQPPPSQSFSRASGWEGNAPRESDVSEVHLQVHCSSYLTVASSPATPPSPSITLNPQPACSSLLDGRHHACR